MAAVVNSDSEFRSGKGKFKNWQDVVKIANEVHLDEMKALLEMHYEDVIVNSTSAKKKTENPVNDCEGERVFAARAESLLLSTSSCRMRRAQPE